MVGAIIEILAIGFAVVIWIKLVSYLGGEKRGGRAGGLTFRDRR